MLQLDVTGVVYGEEDDCNVKIPMFFLRLAKAWLECARPKPPRTACESIADLVEMKIPYVGISHETGQCQPCHNPAFSGAGAEVDT